MSVNRIFILDRSGSMRDILKDTIGGFNSFIDSQRDLGGYMTLYIFDDLLECIYKDKRIEDVEYLDERTFVPRGSTALLDAIGTVITTNILDDYSFVIIFTDGHENTSKSYTLKAVKDLIQMKKNDGVSFMYLGADENSIDDAENLGISKNNRMSYGKNSPYAFDAASHCIRARSCGVEEVNSPLGNCDVESHPI